MVNSVRLVSASAGTGKTHRLVNALEDAILREIDPVRPEGIVATTFTIKAAAELRERVRARLLERGHADKAQRLGAARLGTVNSVCSRLVADFAFDLGISPEPRILDEVAAEEAFHQALSTVATVTQDEGGATVAVSGKEAAAMVELSERWPGLEWLKDVQAIANHARVNGLSPDRVRAFAELSLKGLAGYFTQVPGDAERLERALAGALAAFLAAPHDETKGTAEVVAQARQAHAQLRAGRALSWWEWSRLAAAGPGAASRAVFEPVRAAAREHIRHPRLREDLRLCVTAVFELAAQALEAYRRHKLEWGVMDFIDQEVLALELLGRPAVREMLREQIDLVLVDEFQDTSPLQLAIFIALSDIAPESVWVGDQKQAIYGFRGTDPELMDVAIRAIEDRIGKEACETLKCSWRSRAELVRLTSDVFAPAFETHGIPGERVRLEPAPEMAAEPQPLGPVVEGWRLGGKVKGEQAAALAAAVREMLDDPAARVRDVVTNEARRVEPRDIAVLCRTDVNCARATSALEAAGIRAVRPRTGLVNTPEARMALAALRLWVNPRESLAAAELGRLLMHSDDPDAWLESVLRAPGEAYADLPEVGRIAEAARRLPLAGPTAVFDTVIEAAGVRETCLRWGGSAQRLANLDAMRALAQRYVETCEIEGMAATVAGLVTQMTTAAQEEEDDQAVLSGENAVTVSTLHGAKGLEWPVTVLYEIDSGWQVTAFGVHLVSDRAELDFDDPLGGRWIRYWPDPYAPPGRFPNYRGNTELHLAVAGGPERAWVERKDARETLRLLYVGWTRARDRLVLAGKPGKLIGKTLGLLRDKDGCALICEPEPGCVWAGRKVDALIRVTGPTPPARPGPEAGFGYPVREPRDYPPATVNISALSGTAALGELEELGPAPALQDPVEWAALGSAVHAFLAADREGLSAEERVAMARAILERWSVQGTLRAEDLVRTGDALRKWIGSRWPGAKQRREWPVRLRQEDGSELVGYADLVLEVGDGFVLIDHKCLGGKRDEVIRGSAAYAGQVGAYAGAIARATGTDCRGAYLNLVLQGVMGALVL